MRVKITRYIATVKEIDGDNVRSREIEIHGKRIRPQTVLKQIPKNCILADAGYRTAEYEIDSKVLEQFLMDYGNRLW